MDHGDPLSLAASLPYDVPVKHSGDLSCGQIAMKVEVTRIGGLISASKIDLIGWRSPFG